PLDHRRLAEAALLDPARQALEHGDGLLAPPGPELEQPERRARVGDDGADPRRAERESLLDVGAARVAPLRRLHASEAGKAERALGRGEGQRLAWRRQGAPRRRRHATTAQSLAMRPSYPDRCWRE